MVIFSNEFGSDDPLLDAAHAARAMGQYDAYSFMPHIGIASGRVIVGYVGTPQGYSVSVFGAPVALAARCAAAPLPDGLDSPISSYMSFPGHEIAGRDFEELIPTEISNGPNGEHYPRPNSWRLIEPRRVSMKNLGSVEVAQIANAAMWLPDQTAEDRVNRPGMHGDLWPWKIKDGVHALRAHSRQADD